jgi:TrmH family RNA methyltransferase
VALLRELHEAKGRRQQGLLFLEGTHLLQEVLSQGLVPQLVLATPAWLERHPQLTRSLPAATVVRRATESVLEAAATTRHPDGVVLTLPLPPAGPSGRSGSFVLALDRLQDPGNLGTLLRTALAGGVDQVWLGEGADPWQPKVLRASSGAALALPLERLSPGGLADRLDGARLQGMAVVAAVLPSPAWPAPAPYWQRDWTKPTVLLLGNEGAGVDSALLDRVDGVVTIPHNPQVESLNVAVAAAPLLLERWRQRSGGGAVFPEGAAAGPPVTPPG